MLRRLLVTTIALGAVFLAASPASAKGISYAHFTGPGLPSGGLSLRGERQPLWETGVMEQKGPSLSYFDVSADGLGPAYRATYRMDFAPGRTIRQVVYPYAQGGPVTYTPTGQTLGSDFGGPLQGGWYQGSTELRRFLVAQGFPHRSAQVATHRVSAARPAVQKTSGGSGTGWLWAVMAAVLLALATTVLVLRRTGRARS